jgi:hypothetical protein
MLQSLNDINNDEMKELANQTNQTISEIGKDRKTMLKILGLNKVNNNKSYFQKSIESYPVLLTDKYTKEVIKDVKKSFLKNAYAGKLEVDGSYTFVSPDLYAFCEYLFMGNVNPNGLLNDGEVFCKLYSKVDKLDCLRSPHLLREHSVNKNIVDEEKSISEEETKPTVIENLPEQKNELNSDSIIMKTNTQEVKAEQSVPQEKTEVKPEIPKESKQEEKKGLFDYLK